MGYMGKRNIINYWKNATPSKIPLSDIPQIREIDVIRFEKYMEVHGFEANFFPYSAENLNNMEEWYLNIAQLWHDSGYFLCTPKKGYWEPHDDSIIINLHYHERKYHKCSECGYKTEVEIDGFKYCPKCGAKMEVKKCK